MNTTRDLEENLRTHLAERADERPAEGALAAILAATSAIRPRRSWRPSFLDSLAPGRVSQPRAQLSSRLVWALVLLGLLIALAIGATLSGGLSRRPIVVVQPSLRASPVVIANHRNGPVTIATESGVIAVDPSTGARSIVVLSPGVHADWSPDGGRLATVSGSQLFVTDVASGATTEITSGLNIRSPIAWSPDGQRVAYEDLDGVHVVDVIAGTDRRLPAFPGSLDSPSDLSHPMLLERPTWTPDGQAVRYTNLGLTYATRLDGSGAEPVGPVPSGTLFGLAWSPDAGKIAYFDDPPQVPAPTGGDPFVLRLWVANADGTKPRMVFGRPACCIGIFPSGPVWSPDGSQIAIGVGSFGLFVVDPATSVARNLGASPLGDLSWRPVP